MSDDLADEVRAAVELILRDHAQTGDDFSRRLWQELCATGFHLLGVPEKIGGSGGGLREAAALAGAAAFHGAVVPTVEAGLLGGWLLAQAEVAVPAGLTVAALDEAELRDGRLSGRLRTPWGRYAEHVVVLVRSGETPMVTVVPTAAAAIEQADNLA
ncbi:MAG: acyl-CoA dehydrogenase family protein, partial [Actinomycetota bacterium]|nr:acyl-CoA dehydrogenase family protein [Actinomycetota bacterium]